MQTHAVLETVTPLPQNVILQVEQLETGEEILDEVANLNGPFIVTEGDGVHGQARLPNVQ